MSFYRHLLGFPFRQDYVQAGGVPTRYLRVEGGSGAPVVCVHGAGAHLEVFIPVLPGLARGRDALAYDMVGHGLSGKPDRPYTTPVLAQHLVDFLQALGIPRAVLVGHSLGALVSAWTAAHWPEKVAALVLVTPGTIESDPEVLRRIREGTLRALETLDEASVRERLAWLFYQKEALDEELVGARLAIYRQPGYREAALRALAMQDPEVRRESGWRRDWVGRVRAPTLVLWSPKDPGTPPQGLELLKGWLPPARFLTLEASGHFPTLEEPGSFVRVVGAWLEERGL